ncbi:hypothetical protein ACOTTU_24145 [Roseobacter sp. EG26]|uniref:hypothetical protein n=1 Tax=Roseobacter sp. EG26 TaxID=3412477 RepID=UPI003CE5B63F
MFNLKTAVLGIATGATLGATSATACDPVHQMEYKTTGGWFTMSINGAHLGHGGGGLIAGVQLVQNWIVSGNNVVTVDFVGDPGTISATFKLVRVCDGSADKEILKSSTFSGRRVEAFPFQINHAVDAEYTKAEVSDASGLMEAVEKFQRSVRSGKIDDAILLHEPMLRDYAAQGAPIETVKDHMREMLSNDDALFAQKLVAEPVLGGRIYQVLNADFASPFHVDVQESGGSLSWNTGTYWGKYDGKWMIVAR